jgi:hypothetical protein
MPSRTLSREGKGAEACVTTAVKAKREVVRECREGNPVVYHAKQSPAMLQPSSAFRPRCPIAELATISSFQFRP